MKPKHKACCLSHVEWHQIILLQSHLKNLLSSQDVRRLTGIQVYSPTWRSELSYFPVAHERTISLLLQGLPIILCLLICKALWAAFSVWKLLYKKNVLYYYYCCCCYYYYHYWYYYYYTLAILLLYFNTMIILKHITKPHMPTSCNQLLTKCYCPGWLPNGSIELSHCPELIHTWMQTVKWQSIVPLMWTVFTLIPRSLWKRISLSTQTHNASQTIQNHTKGSKVSKYSCPNKKPFW